MLFAIFELIKNNQWRWGKKILAIHTGGLQGVTGINQKLKKKNLDLIVANNVALPNVGFSHDTNEVTIMSEDSKWTLPLAEKRIIADGILDAVLEIR